MNATHRALGYTRVFGDQVMQTGRFRQAPSQVLEFVFLTHGHIIRMRFAKSNT